MRWIWIDSIVEYEPERRMTAIKNVTRAEEHLQHHFPAQGDLPSDAIMPASLIIEGMAQTAGILAGSIHGFREKVILAKIGIAQLDRDVRPGDSLRYEARIEHIDDAGAATKGIVSHRPADGQQWTQIGRIDLLFSHVDKNISGLEFPEDNFVFTEEFWSLIRNSGLQAMCE
jgi:3-hydroxyacyl-[acyl-carrier-protein] dehydratase